MDIDIGTLLYIVITVIAIIAGIAGKKKKPVPGAAPKGGSEKGGVSGFFENIEAQFENFKEEARNSIGNVMPGPEEELEPIVERDYFEKMSDDYDIVKTNEAAGTFAAYEGIYSPDDEENEPLMSAEGVTTTKPLEVIELDDEVDVEIDYLNMAGNFDARRAIIYSTIINRIEI